MEWLVENWVTVVEVVGAVLALATAVTRLTPSPKDDEVVKKIVGVFSVLEHADVGGVKLPAVPTKKADRD